MLRLFVLLATASAAPALAATLLSENFNNVPGLAGAGWSLQNNSAPVGSTGWFQGNPAIFPSQNVVPDDAYVAANFNNAAAGGNISNWLITPVISLVNGDTISFYTRANGDFPDSLEVRLNTSGTTDVGLTDTSVGDFGILLAPTIDPVPSGAWVLSTYTISGVAVPANSRIAFRYFVTNTDINGDYIGIDTLSIDNAIPEPSTVALFGLGMTVLALRRRFSRS